MAQRTSVTSIGSASTQRRIDTPLGTNLETNPCSVTIHLDGHESVTAVKFYLDNKQCIWFDANDHLVLEHRFQRDIFPWKHSGIKSHGRLTVAFTPDDQESCKVRCHSGCDDLHDELAPRYDFLDDKSYKCFQSMLRGKSYFQEFEIRLFKPRKAEKTEYQFAKIWETTGPHSYRTFTIPITQYSGHVVHQEFELRWLKLEKVALSSTKVEFNFHRRRSSGTNQNPPRRSSLLSPVRRSNSAALNPVVSEETRAPEDLYLLFDRASLQFPDRQTLNECLNLFTMPDPPRWTPSDSIESMPLPSPIKTPPTRSPFSFQESTPPTSVSVHETLSQSPKAITAQLAQDFALPGPAVHEDYFRRGGPRRPLPSTAMVGHESADRQSFYDRLPEDYDSIRILVIEPGRGLRITCSLQRYQLSSPPTYEALSYCWQKSGPMKAIDAGGLKGFPVSKHLWNALRRLRLRNRPRLVWVDAICMNQADVVEKNHQIALMRNIYATALRTLIWIGEYHLESPTCVRCFSNAGEDALTLCTRPGLAAHEHGSLQDFRRYLTGLQVQEETTKLADVWWKRLWCVQEFNFSMNTPTVYAGPHAISWTHFVELFQQGTDPLVLFRGLEARAEKQSHTLFSLLSMTGPFRCTDPRDRIFALLGMTSPETHTSLSPDYRSSVIRVLEDACISLIRESGTVDVLLDGRLDRSSWGPDGERLVKVIPSWLPDLTCLERQETVKGLDDNNAGGDQPSDARLLEGTQDSDVAEDEFDTPRTLKISAIWFDAIEARTEAGDIPPYEHSPDHCLVYNSLQRRGWVIDKILNTLSYDFVALKKKIGRRKHLSPAPFLGRLMMDYLFEGKRSILAEFKRREQGFERDEVKTYERQRQKDLAFLEEMDSHRDVAFVQDRWSVKIKNAEEDNMFIPERMKAAYDSGVETIVEDFKVARDLGNLYAYARHTRERYYFSGHNFDAPMRKDVLSKKTVREVRQLTTQFGSTDQDIDSIEFHEYNEKNRERDFFKTKAGFLGLGPSIMQVGDGVIVPIGSSRPWIVRKVVNVGRPHYRFIGEAVVPSIMSSGWAKVEEDSAEYYHIK